MFCKNCGNKVREGAVFCPVCGTKVVETDKTENGRFERKVERDLVEQKGSVSRFRSDATHAHRKLAGLDQKGSNITRKELLVGIAIGVVVIFLIAMVLMFLPVWLSGAMIR